MKNGSSHLLLGLALGVAAGAIATYLIINNKDSIKKEFDHIKDSARQMADKAKEKAEAFGDKFRSEAEESNEEN